MDDYWTYRRVRFKSHAAGLSYNGLTVAIILYIIRSIFSDTPYLVIDKDFDSKFFARLMGNVRPRCDALPGKPCQEWDWLDVVERPGPQLFVKTFVQETFEVRNNEAKGKR